MTKEELLGLHPGDKIVVGNEFRGGDLYGWEDSDQLREYLGKVITVKNVHELTALGTAEVYFEEDGGDLPFLAEEIDGFVFAAGESDLGDVFSSEDFSLLNLLGGGECFAC